MDTVSLSQLVKDTGETPRTLQHWSDLGILQPILATSKQGRGRHREFDSSLPWHGERRWALVASELNRIRVPLGDIKLIIEKFRRELKDLDGPLEPRVGWRMALENHVIGKAILGRSILIVLVVTKNMEVRYEPALDVLSASDLKVEPPLSLDDVDGINVFPDPEIVYNPIYLKIPWSFVNDYHSSYLINLTKVLEPLVSQQ